MKNSRAINNIIKEKDDTIEDEFKMLGIQGLGNVLGIGQLEKKEAFENQYLKALAQKEFGYSRQLIFEKKDIPKKVSLLSRVNYFRKNEDWSSKYRKMSPKLAHIQTLIPKGMEISKISLSKLTISHTKKQQQKQEHFQRSELVVC